MKVAIDGTEYEPTIDYLHDAILLGVSVNNIAKTVRLICDLAIADVDSSAESHPPFGTRHPCVVVFTGVQELVLDPRFLDVGSTHNMIDASEGRQLETKEPPTGTRQFWVFSQQNNAFMQVTCGGLEFREIDCNRLEAM